MRTLRRHRALFVILLALLVVAGGNPMAGTANYAGNVAGFWKGMWHGAISPIMWFVSLFTDDVHFYEVRNNGNWYNFGFVLGAGILGSGMGFASHKNKS